MKSFLKKIFCLSIKKKKNKNKEIVTSKEEILIPEINIIKTKNIKHLICDDSYTNRLVLKKYLNLYGCEVDEAENGKDAIEKVKLNGEYKIIWMDIKMPKMDGHECTYFLRNDMRYKGEIIGLTGYVDDITIKKCLDLGMNNVVPKPFDKNVIRMYSNK